MKKQKKSRKADDANDIVARLRRRMAEKVETPNPPDTENFSKYWVLAGLKKEL